MDDPKVLGARIKSIRKKLGLTLSQFGERVNMSPAGISNIENGVYAPKASTIALICAVYGINREWLETGALEAFTSEQDAAAPESKEDVNEDQAFANTALKALAKMPPEFWKMARDLVEEIWQQYHPGDTPTDPDR